MLSSLPPHGARVAYPPLYGRAGAVMVSRILRQALLVKGPDYHQNGRQCQCRLESTPSRPNILHPWPSAGARCAQSSVPSIAQAKAIHLTIQNHYPGPSKTERPGVHIPGTRARHNILWSAKLIEPQDIVSPPPPQQVPSAPQAGPLGRTQAARRPRLFLGCTGGPLVAFKNRASAALAEPGES